MSSGSYLLRSPDWNALVARLDALCREKGVLTKSGTPNYQQLAPLCGLSHGTLYQWRRRQIRPSRATLEKVAAYAGQPLGPWLVAAGLDADEEGRLAAHEDDGTIRPARADEVGAVAACVRAAYAPYVARIGTEPAPMCADYGALIARGVVHVLAGPEGAVRGLVVLWPTPAGDALFIENVAVHPRHQGRGLGRRLLGFAERQARAAGLGALELYTNEAMTENLTLYARLGFAEVDRRLDAGYRRVFLRKALP